MLCRRGRTKRRSTSPPQRGGVCRGRGAGRQRLNRQLDLVAVFSRAGIRDNSGFEGIFAAVFRNVSDSTVWVRYDLRFFDQEEFLIDAFIPIGQPVILSAGETRRVEGDFLIRTNDPRDFERLALMRLVARIRRPDSLN